jgi:hypothetical protein
MDRNEGYDESPVAVFSIERSGRRPTEEDPLWRSWSTFQD